MITVSYTTDASVAWRPSGPYVKYSTSHQYQNICKDLDLREMQTDWRPGNYKYQTKYLPCNPDSLFFAKETPRSFKTYSHLPRSQMRMAEEAGTNYSARTSRYQQPTSLSSLLGCTNLQNGTQTRDKTTKPNGCKRRKQRERGKKRRYRNEWYKWKKQKENENR